MKKSILVIGLGEIGIPLREVFEKSFEVEGLDLKPKKINNDISMMHICYPYKGGIFVDITGDYIEKFEPELTIINSTVLPGTTEKIYEKTGVPIAYSPIRGKHTKMKEDLLSYTKYVAGIDVGTTEKAVSHFESAGFKTARISSPKALELAKLLSTTYFGLLIAWAQEVERFCQEIGVEYDEVMNFTQEVNYFPPVIFQPGYIGGHCVMPNIEILKELKDSDFLEMIKESNENKKKEILKKGQSLEERVKPLRK